jgi:hypothetical protein
VVVKTKAEIKTKTKEEAEMKMNSQIIEERQDFRGVKRDFAIDKMVFLT